MVGGQLCFSLHQGGLLWAWACATATVDDAYLHPLIAPGDGRRMILRETGLHAKPGDSTNLPVGPRGTWNTRRLGATVWSRLTTVFQSKPVGHRVWASLRTRVAWPMAACNLLARWGLEIDNENRVRLSIAAFSF
jgi:hypothetical protein